MPSWSKKDKRQYEHIKNNELDRGKPDGTAEEIAARTVNKQRRIEGRTPNQTTQGTGNPHSRLEVRTVNELRNIASRMNISGRSTMRKADLVNAIRVNR